MKNPIRILCLAIACAMGFCELSIAAPSFVESGKEALRLLSKSLSDSDGGIRALAAKAWGEIGNPAAIPVLKRALKDQDDSVRIESAYSLFKLGSFVGVSTLKSIINQEPGVGANSSPIEELRRIAHDKMRVLAIRKLFSIQGKKSEEVLRGLLDDSSGEVRDAAATGLARLGFSDFDSEFLSALESPDKTVRLAAVKDLGDIGNADAFEGLKREVSDTSVAVREEVMRSLAGFPSKTSAPILDQALKDQDPRVRAQALSSLAVLSDSGSISLLQGISDSSSNSDTRLEAEAGLARRGQNVDLSLADKVLNEKNRDLKNLALDVLGAENSPQSNEILARVISNESDIRLRIRAATFLLAHLSQKKRKHS